MHFYKLYYPQNKTLKRRGSDRINLTLMAKPIKVAILHPGMVGEYSTKTELPQSLISIQSSETTPNTSKL